MVQGDVLSLEYYGFDMRPESVFAESKSLRHAFSEAVDKQTLIDTLRPGRRHRGGLGRATGHAGPSG